MDYAQEIIALYEPLFPFLSEQQQKAVTDSANAVASLAPNLAESNQALGDGEILKLLIELFKTLLPILLQLLGT